MSKHTLRALGGASLAILMLSLAAAIPAVLATPLAESRSEEAKKPHAGVTEQSPMRQKLNMKFSNRALLKRQSEFRLPHEQGSTATLSPLSGVDDCPGGSIPGGTYTAEAPYVASGDTTGANNTVRLAFFDYYAWSSYWDAAGPDHIYSFTLTDRGANAQIKVSPQSNSYRPLIYILDAQHGWCPAGTGNIGSLGWVEPAEASTPGGTATIPMQGLPLNVPLYFFVDSVRNDSTGSGQYTLQMQDVTIAPAACAANPIDCTDFTVRQHYRDFLNREPDSAGLAFWTNEIISCGGDAQCAEIKRINVSAAFFLSIEFQQTGYLVYKTYAAAFGPTRIGATVPLQRLEFELGLEGVGLGVVVGAPGWEATLENNQRLYFEDFVLYRGDFQSRYPATMTSAEYVDALNMNAGGALSISERDQLVNELTNGVKTRAQVLRAVVDDADFTRAHFNRAFVLMQYFGYLRRNPNDPPDNNFDGYNFWLAKLDQFNGNFIDAEMVKAFITSIEYRRRFGP